MTDRWAEIVGALEAGRGPDDGLDVKDLRRATGRLDHADGSTTFVVERHPHLFGRPSAGVPSSAFQRLRVTYRYSPDGGVVIEDEVSLGAEIDEDLLALEEVALWREAIGSSVLNELVAATTESEARALALAIVARWQWFTEYEAERIPNDQLLRVRTACAKAATEYLLDDWRSNRAARRPALKKTRKPRSRQK